MHRPDALESILDTRLDALWKGFAMDQPPVRVREVPSQGWTLQEGIGSPALLVRLDRTAHNAAWMKVFLEKSGASICPHGKTTMSPQLFHQQLADGAWGITLATPQEVQIALTHGVRRIVLGNQIQDPASLRWLRTILDQDRELDLTVLVDSLAGVAALDAALDPARPLPVLLEVGIPGGRTGCRDRATSMAVARAVKASPALRLRGVECFEGIIATDQPEEDRRRLGAWLDELGHLARACAEEGLFETEEVLLSAGGSAYFDLVVTHLGGARIGRPTRLLLRSGCYLTHDAGHYQRLVALLEHRMPDSLRPAGSLQPALEVWGTVLSRPEPGLAFLDIGKRDVSHDLHLPRPLAQFRAGWEKPRPVPEGWTIAGLYDQHARLVLPEGADLEPGDRLGLAISHPCTTFDKWRLAWGVDGDYRVQQALLTFF